MSKNIEQPESVSNDANQASSACGTAALGKVYYKFRGSSDPASFEFGLKIIVDQELYCADWRTFNDIEEGLFYIEKDKSYLRNSLMSEKMKIRVCSLAACYKSRLLWAHYADRFTGMAIGVILPQEISSDKSQFRKVAYPNQRIKKIKENRRIESLAKDLLSRKRNDWKYEQEYRIFSKEESIRKIEIPYVIAGMRMCENNLEELAKRCYCGPTKLYILKFADKVIEKVILHAEQKPASQEDFVSEVVGKFKEERAFAWMSRGCLERTEPIHQGPLPRKSKVGDA